MTVTSSGIVITDGYHTRLALGANGQLFIGAHTCTEIIPPFRRRLGPRSAVAFPSTTR